MKKQIVKQKPMRNSRTETVIVRDKHKGPVYVDLNGSVIDLVALLFLLKREYGFSFEFMAAEMGRGIDAFRGWIYRGKKPGNDSLYKLEQFLKKHEIDPDKIAALSGGQA